MDGNRHLISIIILLYKITSSASTTSEGKFVSIPGCRVDYHYLKKPFLVITSKSLLDCGTVCARTSGCYSFNTCPNAAGTFTCSLIAGRADAACASLVAEVGCRYREHRNAQAMAAANPCYNGGTINGATCICVWGFAGDYCDRIIRSCREGYQVGIRGQGWYDIRPFGQSKVYKVWCNCDWVGTIYVFKRIIPPPAWCEPISFNRTWLEYMNGFGNMDCEYFIGLQTIYELSQFANYQYNIYNVYDGWKAASIYLEGSWIKSEADNYELDFTRVFTWSWEHGDDAFDGSQIPRRFCTWDNDCGGCAKTVGAGWWFTSTCAGGAVTAPGQIQWPVHGVMKDLQASYIQIDLVNYIP